MNWIMIMLYIFNSGIFLYSVILVFLYVFIALYARGSTRNYTRNNSFTDYRLLAISQYAPSISILAPAYNEDASIVENVRSLLSLYYNNLEVIVINDGSRDESLQKLITSYELIKTDYFIYNKLPSKTVKGVYRSLNSAYRKLIVVDKFNGGKADALNCGINISKNDYIICIDVDCIMEEDAVLKMVKPFMEDTGPRVIASGGVIRLANSCTIRDGRLEKVYLPKNYWARMQALEYIRAFLLGRMAWTRLNGLLIISGAFGAFDKEIVIKSGGYYCNTVGEDMELVVRMRRYMQESGIPYVVQYIPDPLCWTEAPASAKVLKRQRNRWTRGTIETLIRHRKMFFNPHYRLLGMVSYPYWFFFEMLAPLVETMGFTVFLIMTVTGVINWHLFLGLLLFIITFGYMNSAFAIYMEVTSYNQYNRPKDITKLLFTALTEPFVFHPFIIWSALLGYIDIIRRKKTWGEMLHKGF
ncbi:Glycosyltransferase, catalytic subunit of cellulose synthase and poly-beta-1,6-N-acetylglucosamine synthase [Chitinophaga sp. CF118]|uniref:glycosyltransferase family 2 protein n=1 Tax=Chitinophaga sp. CF118 TaxID=1884367 RepID=UPI0008E70AF5|nr:glycosyltransferase [Chitinophaga sp. CF118]SFD82600.1 Glycosyltransferase, catalytic subunit of cellulose synthase and poly-beta-1,6-N-acetylglucosamine synthase [Chitinophaga sp. CF118]